MANHLSTEPRIAILRRPLRAGWACALLAPALLALTTGCDSFGPANQSVVSRDLYDIKGKLDKSIEDQASSDRQVKYSLNAIDQNLQGRNDQTKTALDDLGKQLRAQADTIERLSNQVQSLNFAISGLNTRLAIAGGTPEMIGSAPAAPGGFPAAPAGTAAAPAAAGAGIDQIMTNGQRQFNLQNYPAARDAFAQALAQNPQGNEKIEALYWLAESYYKLNDLENAEKHYTDLIHANDRHPKAWASLEQLGNIKIAQGNPDLALKLLKQIVDAATMNPPYKYPELDRVKATIGRLPPVAPPPGSPASPAAPAGTAPPVN